MIPPTITPLRLSLQDIDREMNRLDELSDKEIVALLRSLDALSEDEKNSRQETILAHTIFSRDFLFALASDLRSSEPGDKNYNLNRKAYSLSLENETSPHFLWAQERFYKTTQTLKYLFLRSGRTPRDSSSAYPHDETKALMLAGNIFDPTIFLPSHLSIRAKDTALNRSIYESIKSHLLTLQTSEPSVDNERRYQDAVAGILLNFRDTGAFDRIFLEEEWTALAKAFLDIKATAPVTPLWREAEMELFKRMPVLSDVQAAHEKITSKFLDTAKAQPELAEPFCNLYKQWDALSRQKNPIEMCSEMRRIFKKISQNFSAVYDIDPPNVWVMQYEKPSFGSYDPKLNLIVLNAHKEHTALNSFPSAIYIFSVLYCFAFQKAIQENSRQSFSDAGEIFRKEEALETLDTGEKTEYEKEFLYENSPKQKHAVWFGVHMRDLINTLVFETLESKDPSSLLQEHVKMMDDITAKLAPLRGNGEHQICEEKDDATHLIDLASSLKEILSDSWGNNESLSFEALSYLRGYYRKAGLVLFSHEDIFKKKAEGLSFIYNLCFIMLPETGLHYRRNRVFYEEIERERTRGTMAQARSDDRLTL
ncbi:MAG: hypothetical protein PHS57_08160 [Alphaproteobacteria bacterium]|nr:hypothetical protein [Alphaproteobacteria bacterium]